jgi:hypothetical protein
MVVSLTFSRLSPQTAQPIGCLTRAVEIIRPSGCGSYDPPVDRRDMTVSPAFGPHPPPTPASLATRSHSSLTGARACAGFSVAKGNLYYNHGNRFDASPLDGSEPRGRSVKDCVGSPPPATLDKRFWDVTGDNLVIDDGRTDVDEDTGDSTTITVGGAAQ